MGLVLMIPLASHGREHERERKEEWKEEYKELPGSYPWGSDTPSRYSPDLRNTEMKLEVPNQGEHKAHGTIAELPKTPQPISVDNRLGEDARPAVRFKGECRRSGDGLSTHLHQLQKVPWGTRHLRLPPFLWTFQRRPQMGLVLSKFY